jgi:hypothetical protein
MRRTVIHNELNNMNNKYNKVDELKKLKSINPFSLLKKGDSDSSDESESDNIIHENKEIREGGKEIQIVREIKEDIKEVIEIQEIKNNQDFKDDKIGWNIIKQKKEFDNNIMKKEIYDEKKEYNVDLGNDKKLNSHWTVWVHKSPPSDDWTLASYEKKYVISSIGSFWRFFNNFISIDRYCNHIYIMREDIAPIWEDVNNKFGGITSIKIDSIQRGTRTDISIETIVMLTLMMMNETLVKNSKRINGIEFSIKRRSTLIKIWCNGFKDIEDFSKELPISLINILNIEMEHIGRSSQQEQKITLMYKQIKPEYEIGV